MTKRIWYVLILSIIMLALAGCGGEAATPTPTPPPPTETPEPTEELPTNTPVPTVDMSALSVDELQGTAQALETQIAIEERNLSSASGMDSATYQNRIDELTRELRDILALIEEAGAPEDEAEATAEVTEDES